MKFLSLILLIFVSAFTFAQSPDNQSNELELQPLSKKDKVAFPVKMLCDPAANPLEITACAGEDRDAMPPTGDNNPTNGAFMTWTATGTNNLYYSRIYNGLDTFQIVQGGTNNSVYQPDGDGNYTGNLAIGGNTTNQCLEPGTWTVQVWDVMDADGDLLPDRDADGNIIGCFTECTFDFLPSCPGGQPFDAVETDIGCTTGGSISLVNFDPGDIYCDGQATFSWTGPDGFTASTQDISNLDPGTYTFVLDDFYGCVTDPLVVTIGFADPVMITCGNPQAPTLFGESDGSFDVDITAESNDYTIEWAGPVSGSESGNNGNNTVNGLPAGTYDILVTDDVTGCTAECTVTIPDPPCEVEFAVAIDNIGNIIITMQGGQPTFFVSFTGTSTASQDDLGPYNPTPGNPISLSANLFEAGEYIFTVYEENRPDCSNFVEFTIEGADCTNFELTQEGLSQPTCGQDNGSISVSLSGGNSDMTITWVSGPGINGANENSLSLTDLPGGTYAYQAFDEEGCVLEGDFELDVSTAMVFDCSGVGETCPDADDGKLGLSISGGAGPYTLNYNALDPDGNFLDAMTGIMVADGDTLFNLAPGDYFLQLSDVNGCSVECATVVDEFVCPIIPGADQTVTIDSIINAIHVDSTGGVILSFGGTPDWTYNITSTTGGLDTTKITSLTPDTMLNLPIDTYQLVLILPVDTTSNGGNGGDCCDGGGGGPITFIVRGPECMLAVDVFPQDPPCFGEASGAVSLQVNDPIGSFTVAWNISGETGTDLVGLPAGVYEATVTDAAGCEFEIFATLIDPPPVLVDLSVLSPINCPGDADGEILATQMGAQPPINYLWSVPGAADSPVLSGVPAGNYSVTIVDGVGCSAVDQITLTEPDPFDLSCGTVDETNIGASDGKIYFTVNGGTAPLSFFLNGVSVPRPPQDTFTNIAPDQYVLEVIDANDCVVLCTPVVNAGGCGDFTLTVPVTQPDCDNDTGSAIVMPAGNNGIVTFAWSHGPSSALVTDLAPGDYSVTATDEFDCVAIETITVEPFADFPSLTAGVFPTVCASDCAELSYVLSGPGSIQLYYTVDQAGTQVQGLVEGSEGGATLSLCPTDLGFDTWDGALVIFDSLVAGNGCSRSVNDARPISTFDVPTGSITPTICASDTFRLAGEAFFSDRPTGVVVLNEPSASGCDSTVNVNLLFFAPATGNVDPVICASDTFFLAGEAFHADRLSGDVVLENQSANGCDSTVSVNVTFFAPALSNVDPVICANDTFFLAGEAFHADRLSGDVVLENQSANGCDSTVSVNVTFFAPALSNVDPVICANDTFFLAGEAFHAERTTGDVVLENQSANGCDSTVSVNITFFAPARSNVDPVICASDTFFLGGEAFHAERTTGDVVLENQSVNGCDSTVSVNVTFFAPALGSASPVICQGDTFFIADQAFHADRPDGDVVLPGQSVNGCDSLIAVNVTFFAPAAAPLNPIVCATDTFFLDGEAFHADRLTGDVVLENASANGCDSTVSVSLSFFPQAVALLDTTICAGTNFTFGGRVFDDAVDGALVTLDIPTANGCDSLVSVTVRLREVPTVTLSGDGVICEDGLLNISITYDGPAEANVILSSNPGEIVSLVAGTTTIQRPATAGDVVTIISAEDGGSCDLLTDGNITVSDSDLAASIAIMSGDGIFAVSCAEGSDGQVMASPSGGTAPFSFDWNTGDDTPMIEDLTAGTYSLIITSGRGCQARASISLNEPDVLAVQIGQIPATCLDPDPALIIRNVSGGVGPYVYNTGGEEIFVPVGAVPDTVGAVIGTTTFSLEDANGCPLVQDFDFVPAPTGSIQVSPTQALIIRGDSVEVTVLTDLDAAGFLLTPGPLELITQPDFFVSPDSTTIYTVTAVDSAGCTASEDVLIIVDQFVPVYAPTAFSPNQDGNNDRFQVYGRRNVESFTDFNIFDRWGNRVFDFAGPVGPLDENWGWDGRASDGRLRQAGVYVFSVIVTFTDGRTQVVKGDLVLSR